MQRIEAILFEPVGCLLDDTGLYEDVIPALSELKAMGIKLFVTHALEELAEFISGVCPIENASSNTMYLTNTAEGLQLAKLAGVNAILMMNDPDEAMRLAMQNPAAGIVSLHELPDFIRLVAAQNGGSI